jgi:ribosome-binding protein aMBF1 (putative translation factor)
MMVKLSDLPSAQKVRSDRYMRDPEYAAEYERTRFANQVAIAVVAYRAERNISQAALAKELGMQQPAVARLEAGEHQPTITTLERLAEHRILAVEIVKDGAHVYPFAVAS